MSEYLSAEIKLSLHGYKKQRILRFSLKSELRVFVSNFLFASTVCRILLLDLHGDPGPAGKSLHPAGRVKTASSVCCHLSAVITRHQLGFQRGRVQQRFTESWQACEKQRGWGGGVMWSDKQVEIMEMNAAGGEWAAPPAGEQSSLSCCCVTTQTLWGNVDQNLRRQNSPETPETGVSRRLQHLFLRWQEVRQISTGEETHLQSCSLELVVNVATATMLN